MFSFQSFSDLNKLEEVVFCDGGSQDETINTIEDLSNNCSFRVKVVKCNKGDPHYSFISNVS